MLEAMASGLPVICSEIRGNTDLMGDRWTESANQRMKLCPGGIMLNHLQDADVWAEALRDMLSRRSSWKEMEEACIMQSREFGLDVVEKNDEGDLWTFCRNGIEVYRMEMGRQRRSYFFAFYIFETILFIPSGGMEVGGCMSVAPPFLCCYVTV